MRRWLALSFQVPFVAMMWAACSNGPSQPGDSGPDVTTTMDAAPDKKMPPDVGVPDTGPTCMPSATVNMSDITWTPPRSPNPAGCSDVQIQDYYTQCLPGTGTCNTWITENMSCYTCLFSTAYKDSSFGPIISNGSGVVYANIGGCIALELGDTSSTGCGAHEWELSECEDLACSANCPVTSDPSSFTAYQACTSTAETGVCDSYYTSLCDLSEAGAALAPCNLSASTFEDLYISIATVFCGGYPADAGPPTDGGSEASTDASTDAVADAPDGD